MPNSFGQAYAKIREAIELLDTGEPAAVRLIVALLRSCLSPLERLSRIREPQIAGHNLIEAAQ